MQALPKRLSAREVAVIKLIAEGHTQAEIAVALKIGIETVRTSRARAADKLLLRNRVDFVRYALTRGWVTRKAMLT